MKGKAPGKNVLASFKKGKGLRKNVLPLLFLTNPFVTKTYVGFRRSWLETRTKIEISNWFLLQPVNRQKVKISFYPLIYFPALVGARQQSKILIQLSYIY
jgi:hypothetical protein